MEWIAITLLVRSTRELCTLSLFLCTPAGPAVAQPSLQEPQHELDSRFALWRRLWLYTAPQIAATVRPDDYYSVEKCSHRTTSSSL